METLKVQYIDPTTGTDRIDTFRFDITKYREENNNLPVETFFITTGALTNAGLTNIMDMVEVSLSSSPFNPYACGVRPVVYGLVGAIPAGDSIALTKNPQTLGFQEDVPVAILETFSDTTPIAWLIPESVSSTTLDFGTGALSGLTIKQNYVVVQANLPGVVVPTITDSASEWGIKSQMERPGVPTLVAQLTQGSIQVTITPPSHVNTILKYNVYVISASHESSPYTDFLNNPVIAANRKPDLILSPGDLTNKTVATWGGGVNAGGGTIIAGDYFIVVIAKDSADEMTANCSILSNVDYVMVS